MRFVDLVAAQRGGRRARPGAGHPGGARHGLRQRVPADGGAVQPGAVRGRRVGAAVALRPVRLRRGAGRDGCARFALHPTDIGLRMRAAAFAPDMSRLLGVNVGRMLTLGWALAAAVGSLAAMLVVPTELGAAPERHGHRLRLRVHRGGRRRAGQRGRRRRRRAGRRAAALATSAAISARPSPPSPSSSCWSVSARRPGGLFSRSAARSV